MFFTYVKHESRRLSRKALIFKIYWISQCPIPPPLTAPNPLSLPEMFCRSPLKVSLRLSPQINSCFVCNFNFTTKGQGLLTSKLTYL